MPRTLVHHRTTRRVLALALALALGLNGLALAAPVPPITSSPDPDAPAVSVRKSAVSVPANGTFAFQATVAIDRPTSYLEARLQIRLPAGRLLYQKTEVRSNLNTGTITINYTRELDNLDLEPGIYPLELRVRTQSDEVREWLVNDRLLVHAANPTRVPVAIVAYICAAPSMDADGRFAIDPATSVRARNDAEAIALSVLSDPNRRITLAVPGVLLEEWIRAAEGYELATPEGVREVPGTTASAQEYARMLDTLKRAQATGRLEMASVPYGSPDIGALQTANRLPDLEDHLLRGRSAHLSAMGAEPSAMLVTTGGLLPQAALDLIRGHDVTAVVVSPESLATTDTDSPSGTFGINHMPGFRALVTDITASAALASSEASGLVTSVFERSISQNATAPIVASATFGPGQLASSADLDKSLTALAGVPWLEFVTASQAASRAGTETVTLAPKIDLLPKAPIGYWREVNDARAYSRAFLDAVGVNDPDAQRASDLSLMAQSASWAGPDLNWGSSDRGRSLAAAALRISGAVLDTVELGASEITLSGTGGEVPVSIMNASGKNLTLTIRAHSSGLVVDESMPATQQVRPQENFVTVPVELGQSLSGRLTVEVYAGDMLLDEVTVTVRASFLDRLVLIFGVAVVLVGMLLYIRRRVRMADHTDTIQDGCGARQGDKQ